MGKGDGFLRLETVETRCLACLLQCHIHLRTSEDAGKWKGNVHQASWWGLGCECALPRAAETRPRQLRSARLPLSPGSSEEHGFPVCHQVPGSVSPGLINPGKDGYVP